MKFFKKKFVIITTVVVLILAALIFSRSMKSEVPEFSSTLVGRIDLKQTVSETGSVEAELELMYGWETGGKVVEILKRVGDTVTSSDIIARIDSAQQSARLSEAYASLSSAQAKLNLELAGPSDEARQKLLASVEQSKAALVQAEAGLEKVKAQSAASVISAEKALDTATNDLQLVEGEDNSIIVNDVYADLVNILKAGITDLGSALTESDAVLQSNYVLGNLNVISLNIVKNSSQIAKQKKISAAQATANLLTTSDHSIVDVSATVVSDTLTIIGNHLLDVQFTLENTSPSGNLIQSQIDTFRSNITAVQIKIDTSSKNVTNAIQAVSTAKNSLISYQIAYDKALSDLDQAKKQADADIAVAEAQVAAQEANVKQSQATYDDLVVPPRVVDVASLKADVARQAANVAVLSDKLKKTELTALASGVITLLDVEVGENVTVNQEIVEIISEDLTIEVDISESDIAKVSIEDIVSITLDAYGDDNVFEGLVLSIEPAETEISGVVYYKTTIVFNGVEDNYDVRSGMTANVDILTNMREGAFVIPRRALLSKEGKSIVRVVLNAEQGVFEEREVTTGLNGDDGLIEILFGLEEGEDVVTFLKETE
jgi:HlyD family secretion protein